MIDITPCFDTTCLFLFLVFLISLYYSLTIRPRVFNFDNPKKRASKASTLASISQIGDFELQQFRISDSPCRNGQSKGQLLLTSSAALSLSTDGQERQESGIVRPRSNYTFLGGEPGFFGGNQSSNINNSSSTVKNDFSNGSTGRGIFANDSSSRYRSDNDDGNNNNYGNGVSSNGSNICNNDDRADYNTRPVYSNEHCNDNGSSNYRNSSEVRSGIENIAGSKIQPPQNADVSDSQLMEIDFDGE
jgi:hypothetical protein